MSALSPAPSTSFVDTLFSYDNTIMLAAVISLLVVILFVLLLHLYARWFLSRSHRRRRLTAITTFEFSPAPKDTGLDAKAINLIPLFTYKPSEKEAATAPECAVCLSVFEEGEVCRTLPRCFHSFHVECIDTWLGAHSSCPLCRLDVMPAPADDSDKKEEDGKDDVVLDISDDKPVTESSGESSAKSAAAAASECVNLEVAARMGVSRSWRSDVVRENQNNGFQRHRPSI